MKKWKPKNYKIYYWINYNSDKHELYILRDVWTNDGQERLHYYFGNCFCTKKEAQKVLKRINDEMEI